MKHPNVNRASYNQINWNMPVGKPRKKNAGRACSDTAKKKPVSNGRKPPVNR